jgi:putative endonuclease
VLGSRRLNDDGTGDCRTYVGWTNDIDQRLARHNDGTGAKSTRGRAWFLIYVENCETRRDAMSREWHLKHDRKFRAQMLAALRAL